MLKNIELAKPGGRLEFIINKHVSQTYKPVGQISLPSSKRVFFMQTKPLREYRN
jgi:hypothetical protein